MHRNNFRKLARQNVLKLKTARFKVAQKQSGILRNIEQLYDKALANGGFSLPDALIAGIYLVAFSILTVETIFVAIIVFIAIASSGATDFFSGAPFPLILAYWALILLICFAVVFVVNTLFLLFHFIRDYQFSSMLIFSALTTSLAISYLTPRVSAILFENSGVSFSQMALPVAAIFLITQIFLFAQHKDKLCFRSYRNRMQRTAPNAIIGPKTEGRVLVLSAQDHYVEFTTTTGKKLVRMRMREAIAQMQGQDGLSVHRSYWVAKDAIEALQKSGGKHFLLLSNGDKIPVAASKLAAVKKALSR